jgi:hypothetical protein
MFDEFFPLGAYVRERGGNENANHTGLPRVEMRTGRTTVGSPI